MGGKAIASTRPGGRGKVTHVHQTKSSVNASVHKRSQKSHWSDSEDELERNEEFQVDRQRIREEKKIR